MTKQLKLTIAGIYKITNIVNNKIYIGSSNKINIRWNNHKSALRSNRHHNEHLQRSWNKYGEENFTFEILEYIKDESQLIKREQYYIDSYKSYDNNNGFNISSVAGRPVNLNYAKGEDNNLSKLKECDIKEIKELLTSPNLTQKEIASKFNVDTSTISTIKNEKTWKHVKSVNAKTLKRKKSPSAKSKYLGVYTRETKNGIRYAVTIFPKGRQGERLNVGTYSNELAAANVYNQKITALKGDSVLNNIPYMSPEECEHYKLENGKGTIRKRKNNSGFIGVFWQKNRNKWVVRFNDKQIGTHEIAVEAAKIYNRKAIEVYGIEYKKLNKDENGEVLL